VWGEVGGRVKGRKGREVPWVIGRGGCEGKDVGRGGGQGNVERRQEG